MTRTDYTLTGAVSTSQGGARTLIGGARTFRYDYTYDDLDRQTSMRLPAVTSSAGATTSTVLAIEERLTTTYDQLGRPNTLVREATTLVPEQVYVAGTVYNSVGMVTQRKLGANEVVRSYGHDDFRRLTNLTATRAGSTVQNDTLTYDSFGNVSSYASNPSDAAAREKQCFTYTQRQQLNLAKNVALGVSCANAWSSTSPPARPSTPNFSDNYDYTLFGGIESGLSGTNTYGSAAHPHAITATTAGQRVMTYNAAGELELMTSKSGSGASEVSRSEDYTWDRLGRLSSTTVDSTAGGVTSRLTSVYNRYDVDRQRVLRIEDKPGAAPDSVTVFLPGMDFTVTVDAAGVRSHKISRYASIAGTTVAVRSVTTGGGWTIDWLLGNHQGSITAAVRSGSGAVTRNWFDPYGGERGSSTMVTDRGFLGQETDTAAGLSYLNNRYYDPAVGMFLSVDPLVAETGEAYVYGSGNPVTLSDPSGLSPIDECYTCRFYQDEDGNWHMAVTTAPTPGLTPDELQHWADWEAENNAPDGASAVVGGFEPADGAFPSAQVLADRIRQARQGCAGGYTQQCIALDLMLRGDHTLPAAIAGADRACSLNGADCKEPWKFLGLSPGNWAMVATVAALVACPFTIGMTCAYAAAGASLTLGQIQAYDDHVRSRQCGSDWGAFWGTTAVNVVAAGTGVSVSRGISGLRGAIPGSAQTQWEIYSAGLTTGGSMTGTSLVSGVAACPSQ